MVHSGHFDYISIANVLNDHLFYQRRQMQPYSVSLNLITVSKQKYYFPHSNNTIGNLLEGHWINDFCFLNLFSCPCQSHSNLPGTLTLGAGYIYDEDVATIACNPSFSVSMYSFWGSYGRRTFCGLRHMRSKSDINWQVVAWLHGFSFYYMMHLVIL